MSGTSVGTGEFDHGRLHVHLTRLHALIEMGIDAPPKEQIRKIVADSTSALAFTYAEVGIEDADNEDVVCVCKVGDDERQGRTIGRRALRLQKPLLIFDAQDDPVSIEPLVRDLGLRSLLFWPFVVEGRSCVLSFGWKVARSNAISEDEIQYLNFLAALISRLLSAAERNRKIADRINKDSLTGLRNRAALFEHLSTSLSSAERTGSQVAVLYIDLNRFKNVNDTYGHAIGDAALAELSSRMQSVLRKHEIAGRIGGDEFAIIVSTFAAEEELDGIARRVLRAIGAPVLIQNINLDVDASIGVAIYPRDALNASDLFGKADAAMYQAKSKGGSAYSFYSRPVEAAAQVPLRVDAMHFDSQFVLCYQPIVAAQTARLLGAEVLVRWLHPDRGLILPSPLLKALADQQALTAFERLLITTALRKAGSMSGDLGALTLHLNVSQPDDSLLDGSSSMLRHIALEFSEEQVAREPELYVKFMAACRARGYRVGLSHFGSGALSLRTFCELQLDFVKIHAGSLREESAARRPQFVKSLVDQAHAVNCSVIAEQVESESERVWLTAGGVEALQGFEISSPLTEQDFLNWARYRSAR